MLLSEAFEVGLQSIVLLHAGVVEALRQRAQAQSDCQHQGSSGLKACWWVPEQVSFQRGFQRCSSLLSSSSSSSEQLFLQPSAPCASAAPPVVCMQTQVRPTDFNGFYMWSFLKTELSLSELLQCVKVVQPGLLQLFLSGLPFGFFALSVGQTSSGF